MWKLIKQLALFGFAVLLLVMLLESFVTEGNARSFEQILMLFMAIMLCWWAGDVE